MMPIKLVHKGKNNLGEYIREFIIVDIVPANGKLLYRGVFHTIYTDLSVQKKMVETGRAGWQPFDTYTFNMNGRVTISTFQGELPKRSEFNSQNWDFGWAKEFFKH